MLARPSAFGTQTGSITHSARVPRRSLAPSLGAAVADTACLGLSDRILWNWCIGVPTVEFRGKERTPATKESPTARAVAKVVSFLLAATTLFLLRFTSLPPSPYSPWTADPPSSSPLHSPPDPPAPTTRRHSPTFRSHITHPFQLNPASPSSATDSKSCPFSNHHTNS